MATQFTPDDAVQAIHQLTASLERLGRQSRLSLVLLGLVLLSSTAMFLVGMRTHAVQNDALRQVMQENRAIFERLQR